MFFRWTLLSFFVGFAAQASASTLTLDEAQALAVSRQPLLLSQQAAIQAAEQSAVAASQLPDPKLTAGLRDYPVTGSDAFSLTRDNFTMLTLGVMQEFPRQEKRRLRGERGQLESQRDVQEFDVLRRAFRRDAALAWLDVYYPERAIEVVRELERESELQVESLEIDYRAGRKMQADVLGEKVTLELFKEREADFARQAERGRAGLSRWIGADATRPLAAELPATPPPPLGALLDQLPSHSQITSLDQQVEMAETELALARQAYKPDWSLELMYGLRPEFPDFVGVQASIDLPVFPKNRQDREFAAKLALFDKARLQREDALRVLQAEARRYYADWESAKERLSRFFDQAILPQARARTEAALAAYQAGRADLASVLEARRAELELKLQRLGLLVDRARAEMQLRYFSE
jgi:cobalt-zinc-cadmium efflux system outer membrane protein